MGETNGRRYTKTLPVALRDEDLVEMGKQLAALEGEIETLEDERAAYLEENKDAKKPLITKRADLARTIRKGEEYPEVEVQEELDVANNRVRTRRLDTNEIVGELDRPMEDGDRQPDLFDGEADGEADGGARGVDQAGEGDGAGAEE